jgi:hypothetical protein
VQGDRRDVGDIAHDGNHLAEPERGAIVDQALQQRAADAATGMVGMHVDGVLDGPAIALARAIAARVGVAGERAVDFGDQIRISLRHDGLPAAGHLCLVGLVVLVGGDVVADFRGIERGDRRQVVDDGGADPHGSGFHGRIDGRGGHARKRNRADGLDAPQRSAGAISRA